MKNNAYAKKYGPWAVVTGASEGIGRQFAVALAKRGVHLVLLARREDVLVDLARSLSNEFRIMVRVIAVDLAEAGGGQELLEQTEALDVGLLVAAAGFGASGAYVDAALEEELAMIDVNCRAVAEQVYHFARRFKKRGQGGIILMSSIVAFQGVPASSNYAATKAYVQSLAEGLRVELKPWGVDVMASAPGPTRSGFAARANMQMGQAQSAEVVAERTLRALGTGTTVRPGWLTKFLSYSLAMLPRWGRVWVMTQVMAGMTKHQRA